MSFLLSGQRPRNCRYRGSREQADGGFRSRLLSQRVRMLSDRPIGFRRVATPRWSKVRASGLVHEGNARIGEASSKIRDPDCRIPAVLLQDVMRLPCYVGKRHFRPNTMKRFLFYRDNKTLYLPIEGLTIDRCIVDHALSFDFLIEAGPMTMRIECPFRLIENERAHLLDPDSPRDLVSGIRSE
jgi:hypothetical protein